LRQKNTLLQRKTRGKKGKKPADRNGKNQAVSVERGRCPEFPQGARKLVASWNAILRGNTFPSMKKNVWFTCGPLGKRGGGKKKSHKKESFRHLEDAGGKIGSVENKGKGAPSVGGKRGQKKEGIK